MDQTPNTGSFMSTVAPQGAGPALMQLLQRGGLNSGGVSNQTSQGGVMPASPPPMPTPSQGGQGANSQILQAIQAQQNQLPPDQAGAQATPQPGGTPVAGNPEAQIILRAMTGYLKSLGNIQEAQNGVQ